MLDLMSADQLNALVERYGALGMVAAMFLESSVVPVPSEAIVIAAGYLGLPRGTIVWAGAIGSTLGACVGYAIGRSGARWLLERISRWIGLSSAHLAQFDALARRYGILGVLIGRLLPIVPFKIFSITAGLGKVPFGWFVLMTLIGVVPRLLLLAMAGAWLRRASLPVAIACVGAGLAAVLWHWRKTRRGSTGGPG